LLARRILKTIGRSGWLSILLHWLIPILAAVLVIALAVHQMVFSLPQYSW
jgi:hypothetical protein